MIGTPRMILLATVLLFLAVHGFGFVTWILAMILLVNWIRWRLAVGSWFAWWVRNAPSSRRPRP